MKNIWLDLELSGDIDDAVTLLFALESKMNVKAVSLLNPNKEELSFVRYWLDYFNQDIALFVHYDKSIKSRNESHKLLKEYTNETYPILSLDKITNNENYIVLGGGAYTIPKMLKDKGFNNFVLQGGYAGTNLCEEPVLEKFRNKVVCASWNPNIDKKSTFDIIDAYVDIDFISKDICHDSGIDIEFVKTMKNELTKDLLLKYFDGSSRMKNMHDVVALLYIVDNSFCTMEKVALKCKNNHMWYSEKKEYSKKRISINWDKDKFLELFASNSIL